MKWQQNELVAQLREVMMGDGGWGAVKIGVGINDLSATESSQIIESRKIWAQHFLCSISTLATTSLQREL